MASGLLQVVEEMGTLEGHVKVSSVWNRGKELVTGSRARLHKRTADMIGDWLDIIRPGAGPQSDKVKDVVRHLESRQQELRRMAKSEGRKVLATRVGLAAPVVAGAGVLKYKKDRADIERRLSE